MEGVAPFGILFGAALWLLSATAGGFAELPAVGCGTGGGAVLKSVFGVPVSVVGRCAVTGDGGNASGIGATGAVELPLELDVCAVLLASVGGLSSDFSLPDLSVALVPLVMG